MHDNGFLCVWTHFEKSQQKSTTYNKESNRFEKDFVLFSTNVTLIIVRHSNKNLSPVQTDPFYLRIFIYLSNCKQKQEVEKKAASKKLLFPKERERHTQKVHYKLQKKEREKNQWNQVHSIQNGSSANESEMNIRVKHLNASTST